jgi:hypothetical protein
VQIQISRRINELLYDTPPNQESTNTSEFVLKLQQEMDKLHQLAREKLNINVDKMKQR